MYILYDLIWLGGVFFLVLWFGIKRALGLRSREGILERLGFFRPNRFDVLQGRRVIWMHAVSVGETRAAVPLLRALRHSFPGYALVFSNTTETGHGIARDFKEIDLCLFFPFDMSWVVRRFLRRLQPELILIVETELWPNLARLAHRDGIPMVLVNGRLSVEAFPRYQFVKPLLRPMLGHFAIFCMQSREDAQRLLELGAPEERIMVTGNLKFDMPADGLAERDMAALRRALHLPAEALVWVAGSTHPGEEGLLVETYANLLSERSNLLLVLAPRHIERCPSLEKTFYEQGFSVLLRSNSVEETDLLQPGQILLIDTMGELVSFYRAADLVYVGGSLVPVGGHNVLEAAMVGKPALFGPYMDNFRDIARLLVAGGGGIQIDQHSLHHVVDELLGDPDRRSLMGQSGMELLKLYAGATERTLDVIRQVLEN